VVFGLFQTADGVSPTVTAGEILFTMITFTALYGALAVIEFKLLIRAIQVGPEKISAEKADSDQVLTMAY
jgi:cytochrome d ubiquinol oxidase subunit I